MKSKNMGDVRVTGGGIPLEILEDSIHKTFHRKYFCSGEEDLEEIFGSKKSSHKSSPLSQFSPVSTSYSNKSRDFEN